MKTKKQIDPSLIGTNCIATDPHYGSYKGIIRGTHKNYSDTLRVNVIITECISPPDNKAIIFRDRTVNRKPYPIGSTQHFAADQVKPLMEVTP